MSEQDQATFDGWAILEIFGHQRYAGRVKTEAYGQSVFWRIDVPPLEPRERISTCYECIGNTSCPPGTIVQEKAVQGYSKLFGSGAIYCLTPCTQEAAMKAVEDMQARPLMAVKLPECKELSAPVENDPMPDPEAHDPEGLEEDDWPEQLTEQPGA